jgi:hypothetical protein
MISPMLIQYHTPIETMVLNCEAASSAAIFFSIEPTFDGADASAYEISGMDATFRDFLGEAICMSASIASSLSLTALIIAHLVKATGGDLR